MAETRRIVVEIGHGWTTGPKRTCGTCTLKNADGLYCNYFRIGQRFRETKYGDFLRWPECIAAEQAAEKQEEGTR